MPDDRCQSSLPAPRSARRRGNWMSHPAGDARYSTAAVATEGIAACRCSRRTCRSRSRAPVDAEVAGVDAVDDAAVSVTSTAATATATATN